MLRAFIIRHTLSEGDRHPNVDEPRDGTVGLLSTALRLLPFALNSLRFFQACENEQESQVTSENVRPPNNSRRLPHARAERNKDWHKFPKSRELHQNSSLTCHRLGQLH